MSIYLSPGITVYCCVIAWFFGTVMGSFLNCAAWRIAHKESFLKGRSRCPQCDHKLGALELIPVFSWIFLGGKCKSCKKKIPARYPLTELFFGAVTVLTLLRFDLSVEFLRDFVFICCLFCLSLVDLEICEIPNGTLIIAAAAWLIALPFMSEPLERLKYGLIAGVGFGAALLGLSLIMDRVLKRDSLGGGDIKLFAVVGLYLGIVGTLFGVMLACVLGLLFALVRKLAVKKQGAFPFGPAISAAAAVMLLYGEGAVRAYLEFAGLA